MENLTFKLRTSILLLGAINEQPYKAKQQVQLRTIHQYKEKAQKERTKIQGSLLRLREHKKRGKRS